MPFQRFQDVSRRGIDPAGLDLVHLVSITDGFSGAEIEQGIVATLYTAKAMRREFDSGLLAEEYRRSRPLSVLMAEKLAALRNWAAERTVPAD